MPAAKEVNRQRNRLKAVFGRARSSIVADPECQSDYARYLCILVSGFVETAVEELAIEYCRNRSQTSVFNYASNHLRRVQNLKSQKLLQLISAFHKRWYADLSSFIEDGRRDALDSVVNLRNRIAHGKPDSLSLATITQYFEKIDEIVVYLEGLLK
jgi:hypothetical protein